MAGRGSTPLPGYPPQLQEPGPGCFLVFELGVFRRLLARLIIRPAFDRSQVIRPECDGGAIGIDHDQALCPIMAFYVEQFPGGEICCVAVQGPVIFPPGLLDHEKALQQRKAGNRIQGRLELLLRPFSVPRQLCQRALGQREYHSFRPDDLALVFHGDIYLIPAGPEIDNLSAFLDA